MIGVVLNSCQSLATENTQVCDLTDKPSLNFNWLSDVLKSELSISDEELAMDYHKSDHSFLRNLLTDTDINDKICDSQQTDGNALSKVTADPSDKLSVSTDKLSEPVDAAEQSDSQAVSPKFETVIRPPCVKSGRKNSKLHCHISRTYSVTDHCSTEESTDSLLKTPAGFYDRSCMCSGVSIPPLFDYSSDMFSIAEDEKWSEGSEISSVDIDTSSLSAASPAEFSEDTMSLLEDEKKISDEEKCLVLSVVQNVLSDETAALSLDDAVKEKPGADENQLSPEISCAETRTVTDSSQSSRALLPTPDISKLNPLAQPFSLPLQPIPVVFRPNMPTVVVPVKYAYTRLVPVALSKSPGRHPQKAHTKQNPGPNLPSRAQILYSGAQLASQRSVGPQVVPNYSNVGLYCYNAWQPIYCVGRPMVPIVPVQPMLSTVTNSAAHNVKSKSKQYAVTTHDKAKGSNKLLET